MSSADLTVKKAFFCQGYKSFNNQITQREEYIKPIGNGLFLGYQDEEKVTVIYGFNDLTGKIVYFDFSLISTSLSLTELRKAICEAENARFHMQYVPPILLPESLYILEE